MILPNTKSTEMDHSGKFFVSAGDVNGNGYSDVVVGAYLYDISGTNNEGKAYVFHAAAEREAVIKRTVRDFVDRLFGGDPVPLMMHLANHSDLSAEDMDRLERLITKDQAEKDRSDREV